MKTDIPVYSLYRKPERMLLAMNIGGVLDGRYEHSFPGLV